MFHCAQGRLFEKSGTWVARRLKTGTHYSLILWPSAPSLLSDLPASIEQSSGIKTFILVDIVFSFGRHRAEDLRCERERGKTVGGNDGSIAHRRSCPIMLGFAVAAATAR